MVWGFAIVLEGLHYEGGDRNFSWNVNRPVHYNMVSSMKKITVVSFGLY
jgi:hypothetical protein